MIKRNIIPALFLSCMSVAAIAQVPNNGFEDIDVTGKVRHWTTTTLIVIPIDSNGNSDSFVIDQGLYFSTTDAHSGLRALEMRNGFNFTAGIGFPGGATCTTNDSDYAFFETMLPVTATPVSFSFFCKYLPVDNEFGMGKMDVFDSLGNLIGNATVVVAGTLSSYTQVSAPVIYFTPGTAASVSISFRTCMPGQNAAFGTRMVVDDVKINNPTGIADLHRGAGIAMNCFPTLADEELNIIFTGIRQKSPVQLCITDAAGKMVKTEKITAEPGKKISLDVAGLIPGLYFISAVNSEYRLNGKFIRK